MDVRHLVMQRPEQWYGPFLILFQYIENLYTPPDVIWSKKYPTYEDRKSFWRLPTRYKSIQETDHTSEYPLILTTGRLVEYEGGGDESRSKPVAC